MAKAVGLGSKAIIAMAGQAWASIIEITPVPAPISKALGLAGICCNFWARVAPNKQASVVIFSGLPS